MKESATASPVECLEGPTNKESKRTAGFYAVFFLVLGIQFAGMVSGWNGAVQYGFGEIVLATIAVGVMYLLLAACFAELTSIVAFAGGSFGYCRCTLGPFWGYMVGALEALENFLYVVSTVLSIGPACTQALGTDVRYELAWFAVAYVVIFSIHYPGGSFLWNFIIGCGTITLLLVLLDCTGGMMGLDLDKYALSEGNEFVENNGINFMKALFLTTSFFIGIEIIPQTCERVQKVEKNLPWGLFLGSLLSFFMAFWVIFATCGQFPGVSDELAGNLFPMKHNYHRLFKMELHITAILSIPPLFSASVGFMYGCAYQLAALAISGILPSVFAKTHGEAETPVWNLLGTCILQYVVCVVVWVWFHEHQTMIYEIAVIVASLVYIGVFLAFIIFRTRFGRMKRHWVNHTGIAGAMAGIAIAVTLFLSVSFFQEHSEGFYFVLGYLLVVVAFYFAYVKHHQFFSAEEQNTFMKAYVMNANKRGRKAKKPPSDIERFFQSVTKFFTGSSIHSAVSRGSNSKNSRPGNSRLNSVAPAPEDEANAHPPVSDVEAVSSVPPPIAPPVLDFVSAPELLRQESDPDGFPAKDNGELRSADSTVRHPTRRGSLRASWAVSNSMKAGWSGKTMTMAESKMFFDVLSSETENVAEKLIVALPGQFVVLDASETHVLSTKADGANDSANLVFDGEALLEELADGPLEAIESGNASPIV